MRRAIAIAALVIAFAASARTQTFILSGRVVADDTGDPIANARVAIVPSALGSAVTLTDSDGRFSLSAQGESHRVVASKTAYAPREQTISSGSAIEIHLLRAAAVSGRAVDELGDPVVGASVTAEQRANGAAGATLASTVTDDYGDYRLHSLPAGAIAISIRRVLSTFEPRDFGGGNIAFTQTMERTYYPGSAAAADAQLLAITAGDDVPRIDFILPVDRPGTPLPALVRAAQGMPPPSTPSATGSGTMRGRVSTTDGRAIPNARVNLASIADPLMQRATLADGDGGFEFRDLAAGRFRIFAQKSGYALVEKSSRSVEAREGATAGDVDLSLARWRAITGRVVDELGDPIAGAIVQPLQVRYEAGRRRLAPAPVPAGRTDDLGRYRVYGAPPGRYIVSAAAGSVGSSDLPGYTRSYFPGTPVPTDAQFVEIGAAEDLSSIDLALTRARTARIAGRILDAAGQPSTGGGLTLAPSASSGIVSVSVGARVEQDGRFEFPNVTPGQYVIRADRGRSKSWAEGEFGALPVAVNGVDVTSLLLQTSAGSTIKGRITFDNFNNAKTPSTSAIILSPVPIDPDAAPVQTATADIHADWTFEMTGINGARRLEVVRLPDDWMLRMIRVNGIDATDRPLPFGRPSQSLADVEVVLTDRVSQVRGTITDNNRKPAVGAAVAIFASDRSLWYPASRFLRRSTADAEGAFVIAGLPAGSYYAAAMARLPEGGADGWQDPQFLESLLRTATSVTVGEAQRVTLDLRLPSQ